MTSHNQLEQILNQVMEEEGQKFLSTVPNAEHLTDESQPLNETYYVRHRIETVKRIQLTARIDALALARMIDEDYEAARDWSHYVAEELNHDRLYLADLARHGYSKDQVHAIEPFAATSAMLRYLEDNIQRFGAITAVAYSLFVEWNSARYSPKAVSKASSHFSPEFTKGSNAHAVIDDDLDHYGMMVGIAHRLLLHQPDEVVLVGLIRKIAGYFHDYFTELSKATIGESAKLSVTR